MLEILTLCFQNSIISVNNFVHVFGTDGIEAHLYSRYDSVSKASYAFVSKWFEIETMEVEDDYTEAYQERACVDQN